MSSRTAAGAGTPTQAVAAAGHRVLAVELDPHWARHLRIHAPAWGAVSVSARRRAARTVPGRAFPGRLQRAVRDRHEARAPPADRRARPHPRRRRAAAGSGVAARRRRALRGVLGAGWFELAVHRRIPARAFRPRPQWTADPDDRSVAASRPPRPRLRAFLRAAFSGRGDTLSRRLGGRARTWRPPGRAQRRRTRAASRRDAGRYRAGSYARFLPIGVGSAATYIREGSPMKPLCCRGDVVLAIAAPAAGGRPPASVSPGGRRGSPLFRGRGSQRRRRRPGTIASTSATAGSPNRWKASRAPILARARRRRSPPFFNLDFAGAASGGARGQRRARDGAARLRARGHAAQGDRKAALFAVTVPPELSRCRPCATTTLRPRRCRCTGSGRPRRGPISSRPSAVHDDPRQASLTFASTSSRPRPSRRRPPRSGRARAIKSRTRAGRAGLASARSLLLLLLLLLAPPPPPSRCASPPICLRVFAGNHQASQLATQL